MCSGELKMNESDNNDQTTCTSSYEALNVKLTGSYTCLAKLE